MSFEPVADNVGVVGTEIPRASWGLIPALGVSASATLFFFVGMPLVGYGVLVASLVLALILDRDLFVSLLLIGIGLVTISTISVAADISWFNMVKMGFVLACAVAAPYLLERFVFHRRTIRFPIRRRQKWSLLERAYLPLVLVLGWSLLPPYFIGTGIFHNWPAIHAPDELARLFVGVNFVGIWDELFFICTAFALLKRHFPVWQANILQAIIFVSFLWELGYQGFGPLLTTPFALLQAYIFTRTKSLTYVVCVHLLFDLVVYLVLVHGHNPGWLPFFLY
jgi:Type II CAAX prenyl endopeptidase Rce1-like